MANFSERNQEPLIFFEEYNFLMKFIFHIWLCIVIFGLVSNTINILVFAKIGFRDNVTVTLLFLSLSDLLNLILNCPIVVAWFIEKNFPDHVWPFHPKILSYGIYWWAYTFYDYSSFVSVFLALVRCACVSRPLRFKSMFTISRTVTILGVLFLVAVTLRAPVLTVFRLSWAVNPLTNSTFRSIQSVDDFNQMNKSNNSIQFASIFRNIYKASDILNMNIIPWIAYLIMVSCVVVLVSHLQAASKFRRSLQSGSNGSSENSNPDLQNDRSEVINNPRGKNKKPSDKMSPKDLQVIKSVTLICVIFIVSQLPYQVTSTVRLIDPEYSELDKKRLAFGFGNNIGRTFGLLNPSVNIFVHYFFNTRYRDTFRFYLSKRSAKV